jgi:hypothetical protein
VVDPSRNRILFVPGKNPKPTPALHREWLWRCLVHGTRVADSAAGQSLARRPDCFALAAWNALYYGCDKLLEPDQRWIEQLLATPGAGPEERRAALSWRTRRARLAYWLADWSPFILSRVHDPAITATIRETEAYFSNHEGIGARVRERVKQPLRAMLAAGDRVLLIGHSLGAVIGYDALWELWVEEGLRSQVDMFLTLGSPLGMHYVQRRLLGFHHAAGRRFPGNIRRWRNVAAHGDLTALDPRLADDFAPMLAAGLTESIVDEHDGVFNFFRNADGLNVHRSYGYLVQPRVGHVVARWWHGF